MVGHRIHDDEPDTSEATLRTLLDAECPEWAGLAVEYLRTSGTATPCGSADRSDADVVVRLPRRPGAAVNVAPEAELLRRLSTSRLVSVVSIPKVLHVGEPHEVFPHRRSVFGWLDGSDAWSARAELGNRLDGLAYDLGEAVARSGRLPAISPLQHAPLVSGEVRSSRSCEDWCGSTIRDGVNLS